MVGGEREGEGGGGGGGRCCAFVYVFPLENGGVKVLLCFFSSRSGSCGKGGCGVLKVY